MTKTVLDVEVEEVSCEGEVGEGGWIFDIIDDVGFVFRLKRYAKRPSIHLYRSCLAVDQHSSTTVDEGIERFMRSASSDYVRQVDVGKEEGVETIYG